MSESLSKIAPEALTRSERIWLAVCLYRQYGLGFAETPEAIAAEDATMQSIGIPYFKTELVEAEKQSLNRKDAANQALEQRLLKDVFLGSVVTPVMTNRRFVFARK